MRAAGLADHSGDMTSPAAERISDPRRGIAICEHPGRTHLMHSKLLSLGLGVGLVALSTSSVLAAGGTVFNGRGSNAVAQVVWGTSDPVTGAGHYGGVYGDVES